MKNQINCFFLLLIIIVLFTYTNSKNSNNDDLIDTFKQKYLILEFISQQKINDVSDKNERERLKGNLEILKELKNSLLTEIDSLDLTKEDIEYVLDIIDELKDYTDLKKMTKMMLNIDELLDKDFNYSNFKKFKSSEDLNEDKTDEEEYYSEIESDYEEEYENEYETDTENEDEEEEEEEEISVKDGNFLNKNY